MKVLVIVSGYFNPIHKGHIRLLKDAKELGDEVLVIVNNDAQQLLKKGKVIMEERERMEIVEAVRYVDHVVLSIDEDSSVVRTLEQVARDYSGDGVRMIFANGGDRESEKVVPETPICRQYGIETLFSVGGNQKLNSSSAINQLTGKE